MNTQQLRIVLEVGRTGSISKAAANLYLSQPTASSNIRAVEREMGYPLFVRTNAGIALTEQGRLFMDIARRMLREYEDMAYIRDSVRIYRLRLGIMSYAPTVNAFLKFCKEYEKQQRVEVSCINISADDGLKALCSLEMDMMAFLISRSLLAKVKKNAEDMGLCMKLIKDIPLNINLRRGHPLVGSAALLNREERMALLAQYPYVGYESIPNLMETASSLAEAAIPCKYRIAIDERDTRCRIVSATDAFSIGCKLPEELMQRYDLISYPISADGTGLYCIFRREEESREELVRYRELLEKEVEEI